jgi:ribosomal protein S20
MNDTEIRTLMQLLTSYSEKTLNQLNKDLNSNIDKSSMDGGYLKSKGADRYKSELVKLLEKMMRDLKK